MASKTDICNRALGYIGAQLITSFDENTKSAKYCRLYYQDSLEEVLRSYPWNFATTVVELNVVTDSLGNTAFQLPADCLRPLDSYPTGLKYDVQGEYIYTDYSSTFTLKYIRLIEDVNKFDVMFRKELSQSLAIEMSESLTGSTAKEQQLISKFERQKAFTQNVDSQDDNEDNYLMDGEMLNVRLTGSGTIGPKVY